MKRLLLVALPAGLVLLASIFLLNAWRARGEGYEARLERARIKREFVERSAAARSMAVQPPEAWREESAALLRWYLEANAALRNRYPGEPPRQGAVALPADEKKGKQADRDRAAVAEFQQYADGRAALIKAGRYAPVASSVAEGLRLDLLAVEAGPNPDGGGPGLRVDFALWGVPRTLEREGSGDKTTSRGVLGVTLRQLGIRLLDARGQLFGGMQGGGEPAIKLADPERFTDDLPPSVLFGTWWLDLLPRAPVTMELELTAAIRGASGHDRPAVFTASLPVDEAWRLPAGVEFKAEVREGAAPRPVSDAATPAPDGDAPLHELSRDALSAFLYAALLPEEALQLVKSLRLSAPGFRAEGLSEVEWCDLLADEIRAAPETRRAVLEALRHGLKEPAFAHSALDPVAAEELLEVAGSDHGLAIALWRLVADPQPEVRARGAAALERLASDWYGPAPAGEAPSGRRAPEDPAEERAEALAARLATTEEKLARGEERAQEARRKAEEAREKLQAQVKEARAEAARAVAEAARGRELAEQARQARARAEAELAQARATDQAGEVPRLKAAVREAETARHVAEAQAARLAEQVARLEEARATAAAREAAAGPAGAPGPVGEPAEAEPDEAPASWLLPVFTEEFYDSLRGWDRRIQRAAVKQAFLLSQDHRHPSLRALPLGGLPGYYRVRVATDVRLIYRRDEARQDAVEILSVIDREDLDRYVRQAKTR